MGEDALQVYCWNIQTNNGALIEQRKAQIKKALFDVPPAYRNKIQVHTPWVLAILENKRDGEQVGHVLKTELGGEWFEVVDVGGTTRTRENIVIVGSGCMLKGEARAFDGWRVSYDEILGDAYRCTMDGARALDQARERLSRRSKTNSGYGSALETITKNPPKPPEFCRNPALITVNVPGVGDFKLGFLHAPGPGVESMHSLGSADEKHLRSLAGVYAKSVMATLPDEGLHALLGDFNLYDEGPSMPHMSWFSKHLGPTTCYKDTGTGVPNGGRFDRVYARPEMCAESEARKIENFGDGLTDHCAVGVALRAPSSALKRKREEDHSPGGDAANEPDLKRHEVDGVDKVRPG